MEQKEIIALLKRYILSIDFSSIESKSISRLLSAQQSSPVRINANIGDDEISLYGKQIDNKIIPIKFSSLQRVDIEAYFRILPVKSVGFNPPANVCFLYFKLLTKKGFSLSFETRDYEEAKNLLKRIKKDKIDIVDKGELSQIILTKSPEEIDRYLEEHWKRIAMHSGLSVTKTDYSNT